MCVPFLLVPSDFWLAKDEWTSTLWFANVYGILWSGAALHALLTLLSSVVLSNIVGSAHTADAEAVLAALAERQVVAGLCGRRTRVPVLTAVLEILLLLVTLGTSGRAPTILLLPFIFFRPCLLFFLLACSWSIWWMLPAATFGFFIATAVFCMILVVGTAGSAMAIVEEHSSELREGRVRLAIHGVVRGVSGKLPKPRTGSDTISTPLVQ